MTTYSVRKLVARALRLCNALEPGEAPDGQEESDALDTLNHLIDSWNTERLMLPFTLSQNFNTIIGQGRYSIGIDGDWEGQRPQKIVAIIANSGGSDYNLEPLDYGEYSAILDKSIQSPLPEGYFYEATYPLGGVYLYPVPTVHIPIAVASEAQLAQVTLDTDVGTLPPGYIRALSYNLALDLSPEYKDVSAEVKTIAKSAKDTIKRQNSVSMDARIDVMAPKGHVGGFDWRTG